METKKVGLWIRVSHENSVEKESPEVHIKRGRMYAESKGWEVVETYRLDAKTGKMVMEYPETKKMLEDIRKGRITGLIFSKLARLGRNTKELIEFSEYFKKYDADLISLHESIDTSTPAGRLFFTVVAALAQFEREEIAERVAQSVPIRAKMGKPLGGAAPFGYMYDNNKQIILHPQEAPVRKLMYELFLEHKRKLTVAKILNDRGYRTREGNKKAGTLFSGTTVERLLRDPIAIGKRVRNYTKSKGDKKAWELKPESEWVVNHVPPIISEDVWNQCLAILNGNKSKNKDMTRKTVNLFSGYIYCHCNPEKKIYVIPAMKKYVCTNPKCRNKIPIEDIEDVYIERIKHYLHAFDTASYLDETKKSISDLEILKNSIEAEIQSINGQMNDLFDLLHTKQIPKDGFGKRYNPLETLLRQKEDELINIQSELDFAQIQAINNNEALKDGQDIYDKWPTYEYEKKRSLIETVTHKITVFDSEIEIVLKKPSLNSLRNVHESMPLRILQPSRKRMRMCSRCGTKIPE